ncbi:MAG: NADH-quinone oxidoreductase subunit N [Candidatus Poseidoniaceae archaeon]|nr:NADH-quinone oxidoreductase subunit N [Candidatus Poseidoniaceae archaeon]
MAIRTQIFSEGGKTWEALAPELTLVIGFALIIIVSNLGNAKWRIPLTQTRIPVFFGGKRFEFAQNPQLPGLLCLSTLLIAFWQALLSQSENAKEIILTSGSGSANIALLHIDGYSRMFGLIILAAMILVTVSSLDRLPVSRRKDMDILELMNNRRQADYYILILSVAIGMSIASMSVDLFMLFVGLEIASLSAYVLVAFSKETPEGAEGGVKYFIVGAVTSAIGLYGISLLYLWNGNLQLNTNPITGKIGLADAWAATPVGEAALPLIALGMILVSLGFKVSAVPFHFATPDAYSGASSPIAGMLATASKALGFLVLLRILIVITLPETQSAPWYFAIAVISVITMTWGNLAALTSSSPKRMLAYSSVAHAGYLLAAVATLGAWSWGGISAPQESAELIVAAIIFHLAVLVTFKMGAFLVISIVEIDGGSKNMSSLSGLARRDPIIAVSMFLFMMALAGVPPLAGFMSKFLVIGSIVKLSLGDAYLTLASGGGIDFSDVHWTFWLALSVFLNSAISLFYYLRVGVVMFFEAPENSRRRPLPRAFFTRIAIYTCVIGTIFFGISPDHLIRLTSSASMGLLG